MACIERSEGANNWKQKHCAGLSRGMEDNMIDFKRLLAAVLAALLVGCAGAEGFEEWVLGETEEPVAEGWDDWDALPSDTPAPTLPALTLSPDVTLSPDAELPHTQEPAGQSAEAIPVSALEDDGMLKVWLRSLDAPQSLTLTLEGDYAVEGDRGFRFDRDTRLTLSLVDGEVWMAVGGLNLDMGPALTLTRHLDGWGDAGGIYIDESEKPNLYCGDLSVSAASGSLRVVLDIHIEDYLKGVVAYEMSDSFPLEALKAQAVAARTYAMQRKWSSGSRWYNLVDTTADQVYKGCDPAYANVAAAVDETRGIVGTWQGGFATCYYTASNGGQTALASQLWGDNSADGYLTMRDDPYDLENPRSLENDLTFSAHCDGSLKLKQLLEDALGSVMAEKGFKDGEWAFDAIADIEPVNPRFPGSYLYDQLAFDLRVRVAESALATPAPEPTAAASTEAGDSPSPAATQAPAMDAAPEPEKWVTLVEPCRVTLNVFDDIKDGLSLGLNGSDCELISVEKVDGVDGGDAFRLVMRRFGHGVGMSQRGAQTMAGSHGKTFMEILGFYYPGMTVERMAWPDSPLTALDNNTQAVGASRPRPTPLPTPAPLPPLKDGERYGTVNATTLNLRERPTTASRVMDILDKGRRVIVSDEPDTDGWVPVHTAECAGFVKAEYLDMAD